MWNRKSILSAVLVSGLASEVSAFSSPVGRRTGAMASSSTTALHLKPCQGTQLVAAFNAACTIDEEEHIHFTPKETSRINAARALMSRVFHLPSAVIGPHPSEVHIEEKTTPKALHRNKEEDIAIYPIVGFQWVNVDGELHVLPSATSASCKLPNLHSSANEEPYGWYSPSCKLGSPYLDDNQSYCGDQDKQLN